MKIRIKLSSGKTLKLTGEELKELLDYKSQKVFCIIFHYWFRDSKGFRTQYVIAENELEARKEALLIKESTESTFNRCAYEIIEVFQTIEEEVCK